MSRFAYTVLVLGCLACHDQVGNAQEVVIPRSHAEIRPVSGLFGGQSNCDAQACPPTHKVCVPVPDKIKKTTVVYGCVVKDFCLPKCALGGLFGGCCSHNGCPTGECEHVRSKRVLLKKVVTEECPSFKCVVEERPGGDAAACGRILCRLRGRCTCQDSCGRIPPSAYLGSARDSGAGAPRAR
ncbi:MAG: hypothetical protein L0215_23520 [Gemmataceae bacterium]|nr:hypothetical protein [Gemmataceae bacterium]